MNLKTFSLAATAGLCACLFSIADAQRHDPFDYRTSNVVILQSRDVQQDMGITVAQRSKMNVFASRYTANMHAYVERLQKSGQKPKVNDALALRYIKELKESVLAQLTPKQLQRLREITLQSLGASGMIDSEVAARVGIPEPTRKKLLATLSKGREQFRKVEEAAVDKALAPYRTRKPKSPQAVEQLKKEASEAFARASRSVSPQLASINANTEQQMLALLNQKQRRAWEDLLGRPFRPAKHR